MQPSCVNCKAIALALNRIFCRFCVTLLCLCSKFPMLWNGGITLDEALLNISVTTTFWLSHIYQFHVLLEVYQVAASQQLFCLRALLPT
jgi:hypothetical protein